MPPNHLFSRIALGQVKLIATGPAAAFAGRTATYGDRHTLATCEDIDCFLSAT